MQTEVRVGGARLELARGDITTEAVDAIVNAANNGLQGGGGVDGAIHRAGGPAILEACRAIGHCETGDAVLTTGGALPARYVIHTVGPVWRGGHAGESRLLASCYRRSLEVARAHDLRSIAFPSISTGVYGYPAAQAAPVALGAVRETLRDGDGGIEHVRFVLFDKPTFTAYAEALALLDGA
ncbi:MAG: O-acetyl-ADP-ribose deacetylase [Planctomycetota bacterium]